MVPLEALRHVLFARRRLLFERASRTVEDLRWLDAHLESEAAPEDGLRRLAARLVDRDREELAAIVAALRRIADGDYGRCDTCRQPIAVERLWVMPEIRTCYRCDGDRAAPEPRPGTVRVEVVRFRTRIA